MHVCIIPAYKPSMDGLVGFTNRILADCTDLLPLVVDDGSGVEYDYVFEALDPRVQLIRYPENKGKGHALKVAIAYAIENMPEVDGAVTADADGQHRLEDVCAVVKELDVHSDALVLGKRKFEGDVPLRSKFGNGLTKIIFSIASGVKVADTQTGLRAFSRDKFSRLLEIKGERYEYEMNMLLYLARDGVLIREVPIKTIYIDDNAASHFHPVRDSLKIYFCILKFVCSSFVAFLIDYAAFLLLLPMATAWFGEYTGLLFATILARVISASVNFSINKWVVFKSREKTNRAILKFFTLAAVIVLLDYVFISFLIHTCGIHEAIAKIISGVTLFFVNMVAQGRLVFKKSRRIRNDA